MKNFKKEGVKTFKRKFVRVWKADPPACVLNIPKIYFIVVISGVLVGLEENLAFDMLLGYSFVLAGGIISYLKWKRKKVDDFVPPNVFSKKATATLNWNVQKCFVFSWTFLVVSMVFAYAPQEVATAMVRFYVATSTISEIVSLVAA